MMLRFLLLFSFIILRFSASAQFFNDGSVVTLQRNSILYVDADFIQSNGEIENEGTIALTSNWYNLSPNAVFANRKGTVELTGKHQLVGGTRSTGFGRLVLSGEGLKALEIDQDVFHELDLRNSELATGDFILHLKNPSQNSLSRKSGFVSSSENGGFKRQMSLNHDYLFPLGLQQTGKNYYRPVVIKPDAAADNSFTAALLPQSGNISPSFTTPHQLIEEINRQYYFKVIREEGTSPVSLSVFYDSHVDGDYNTLLNWNKTDDRVMSIVAETGPLSSSFDVPDKKIEISQWNNFSNKYYLIARTTVPTLKPLEIPNVISANRDGKNDMWRIPGIEKIPNNEVVVFNRWGTKVFHKVGYDNQNGWMAENITAGTYFYSITIKPEGSDSHVLKGYLTVIK